MIYKMVKKIKKKSKKTSSKKAKVSKPVVEAKAVVAAKVVVKAKPVVEAKVVVKAKPVLTELNSVNTILQSLLSGAINVIANQKQIVSQVKLINRLYKKEIKLIEQNASKARRNAKKDPNRPKRAPSGFAVPSKISEKMCDFLELDHGTELSRTDITKKLTTYIREKKLQIPSNRRSFEPDELLGGILGPLKEVDQDKGYTYFNLQRYITPHIVSKSKSASA
jgi:chromatin remodeling complex protein RSC6